MDNQEIARELVKLARELVAVDLFKDLPQDLTKLSKSQQKKWIDFLVKKPLRELRRNQDIVLKQIP